MRLLVFLLVSEGPAPLNSLILGQHGEHFGACGGGHGAQGRDRTTDTAIFSRMLYQLSYLGVPPNQKGQRERRFIVRTIYPVHHASH
jgi:hypothetical protein